MGHRRLALAIALLTLGLAACGTRVDKAAFYRALQQQGTTTVSGASAVSGGATATATGGTSKNTGGPQVPGVPTRRNARAGKGTSLTPSVASLGLSTAEVGKTIYVGLNIPLTGAAPVPSTFQDAIDVVQNYLNAGGGINGRQVKFLVQDDGYDPAKGLAACRKLADSNILFAVGHTMPTVEQECTDFYGQKKIPYIMRGIPESTLVGHPLAYFGTPSDDLQAKLLADYVVRNLGGTTKISSVVTENDQPTSKTIFANEIKAGGGKLGGIHNSTPRQSDFSAIINQLQNVERAQIVFLNIAPVDAIKIAVQSQQQGYHPIWVGEGTHWNYNLSLQSAGQALDGAVVFSPWASVDSAAANTYKAAYAKYKPNGTPDDLGLIIWGYGNMIRQTLINAAQHLSRASFVQALNSLNFSQPYWNPVRYTAANHFGPRQVCVFRGDGQAQRWRQIQGFTGAF